jgi:hypothetical protein
VVNPTYHVLKGVNYGVIILIPMNVERSIIMYKM